MRAKVFELSYENVRTGYLGTLDSVTPWFADILDLNQDIKTAG